jgi:uncharacterized protein (TIRG00374 family)
VTGSRAGHTRLRAGWMLRVAISVAVLAVIFYIVPVAEVIATIRRIDLKDWALTLAVFLAGHVVAACKWSLLANSGAPMRSVLLAHFSGLVANLSLPGVAGGDVVRAAILYRAVRDKSRLALGSVADRLIDSIGLLVIAAAGVLMAIGTLRSSFTLLAWIVALLVAAAVALVVGVKYHRWIVERLRPGSTMRYYGDRLSASLIELSHEKGRLSACLVLSMAVQASFILANVELANAAGLHVALAAWFFAWPLSKLIATLPISIAGIGVREASLAGFLAPFGAPAAQVIGIGLLWQTIQIAGGILGGLALMLSNRAFGSAPAKSVEEGPNGAP